MAKIVKTKSGKYQTVIFTGYSPDGKRIRKSITAATVKEVKRLAAEALLNPEPVYTDLTVREAYQRYIDSKSNTLSPSTFREYKKAAGRDFPLLLPMKLSQLNNELIQTAVNEIAAYNSPKTVHNKFGFLKAVLTAYHPALRLNIHLPQKVKPIEYVPTDEDIHILLENADEKIRVPILLAAFAGLRESEVCALNPEDIHDFTVTISKAKVRAEGGSALKAPKTNRGYRTPPLSPDIAQVCRQWKYFGMSPSTLRNNFTRLRDRCGVPIHFHLLRHYYCASLIRKGLDFLTIMTYCGWETVDMVTKVYGYVMKDKEKDERVINIYSDFSSKKNTSAIG